MEVMLRWNARELSYLYSQLCLLIPIFSGHRRYGAHMPLDLHFLEGVDHYQHHAKHRASTKKSSWVSVHMNCETAFYSNLLVCLLDQSSPWVAFVSHRFTTKKVRVDGLPKKLPVWRYIQLVFIAEWV